MVDTVTHSQEDDVEYFQSPLRRTWLMSSSLAHTDKCLLVILALERTSKWEQLIK